MPSSPFNLLRNVTLYRQERGARKKEIFGNYSFNIFTTLEKIKSKQEILFFAEITVGHFKPLWDQIHQVEQESSKKLENRFYPCGSQKIFWNNHPYKKNQEVPEQNSYLRFDFIILTPGIF